MSRMRMTKDRAADVMARLQSYAEIKYKNEGETEASYIAMVYSCSLETAARMIETARHIAARAATDAGETTANG